MTTGDVSVVVLTFNNPHLLPACLASIESQRNVTLYERVLFDNGSTPPVGSHPGWRVEHCVPNVGHLRGQNLALLVTKTSWVLFVADDVRLHPGCLAALWRAARLVPDATQLQPVCVKTTGRLDQAGMDWRWPGFSHNRTWWPRKWLSRVPIVPSTCYLLRRAWWESHPFREDLEGSHEDVAFALDGGTRWVVRDAVCTHLVNQTLRRTQPNPAALFRRDRRRVLHGRYRGLDLATRLVAVSAVETLADIAQQTRRVIGHGRSA